MKRLDTETKIHPDEARLADLMSGMLSGQAKEDLEKHLAGCDDCLAKLTSAHEAVKAFRGSRGNKKRKGTIMNKINVYLTLAIISFTLSFMLPRYFIQMLVATLILGIKWVVDSKNARMLVMIYDAWKKGGSNEASRVLQRFDENINNRI